jgi:hypothetical protein
VFLICGRNMSEAGWKRSPCRVAVLQVEAFQDGLEVVLLSDSRMQFMVKKKSRVELDDYKTTTGSERSGSNWEPACRQYFRHSPTSNSSLFTFDKEGDNVPTTT